jgi:hypothetical protein
MKNEEIQWLQEKILEFMAVIDDCLSSTIYTSDRPIYINDLAISSKWLIRLHKKESVDDICREIISKGTAKYFGDYWRQGPWGDNEMTALNILQQKVKEKFRL